MKIFLNILLIFTFLAASIGHIFIFSLEEYSIKKEMKRAIVKNMSETELTTITILKSDLYTENGYQLIEDNELKCFGEMYDIVNTIELKDSIKYICIHDDAESELISNFIKYSNSDKSNSPIKQKIITSTIDNYVLSNNEHLNRYYSKNLIFNVESKYLCIHADIESPPPENLID